MSDYRIDHCRSCGADIIWAVTVNDRPIPVDATTAPGGNLRLEPRGHTMAPRAVTVPPKLAFGARLRWPHHGSCPHGKSWKRKPGGRRA